MPSRLPALAAAHADRRVGARLVEARARKRHHAVPAVLEDSGPAG